MPLFTVMDSKRKMKYLVSADKINDIITKACEKMILPHEDYKLVLEENGAVMDEDEFLLALPVLTNIMILKKQEDWQTKEDALRQSQTFSPTAENNFNRCPSEEQLSVRREVLNITTVYEKRSPLSFPWSALPDSMKEKLEIHETLSNKDCRELRKIMGIHMIGTLKDYRRNTASSLINIFVNKYPQALKIVDADGEKLSDGKEVFLIRLYDHINYKKPSNEKNPKKRRATSDNIIEEEINQSNKENIYHDEYGCVAYQMPLPLNETKRTQEEKRLNLIEKRSLWKNLNEVESVQIEIEGLMEVTYATQRRDIIDRKTITEVLEKWPCLQDVPFFINHASVLFGKNAKDVWCEQESKGIALFHFFQSEVMKKNQVSEKRKDARMKMKNIISEACTACKNLHTDTPKLIAVFSLLPLYFLENEMELFHLLPDISAAETIKSFGETERPILIITGKSLFDEEAKGEIFVAGEKIVEPKTLIQGFFCLLLTYYIYGYTYGENSKKTLEFIQRVFQKINPTNGHKRGKNAKRNLHTINPQVKGLMDRIGEVI